MAKKKEFLSTPEAAKYLGVSDSSLRQGRMGAGSNAKRMPAPPFLRLGKKILYVKADLDEWLRGRRVAGSRAGAERGSADASEPIEDRRAFYIARDVGAAFAKWAETPEGHAKLVAILEDLVG